MKAQPRFYSSDTMNENTKTLLLKEAKAGWESRYQRKSFSTRWTASDDRKEPKRQGVPGEKPGKEPVFMMGGKWVFMSEGKTREIVTVEKSKFRLKSTFISKGSWRRRN
jgi:hypothetical protein